MILPVIGGGLAFLLGLVLLSGPDATTSAAFDFFEGGVSAPTQYGVETGAPLAHPLPGRRVGRGYGKKKKVRGDGYTFHGAVDIGANLGEKIYAIADGKISYAKTYDDNSCGIYLIIKHSDPAYKNGKEFGATYCHMQEFAPGLGKGSTVVRGQYIGTVGMTGNTTTPHLHLALWEGSGKNHFDPKPWIELNGYSFAGYLGSDASYIDVLDEIPPIYFFGDVWYHPYTMYHMKEHDRFGVEVGRGIVFETEDMPAMGAYWS